MRFVLARTWLGCAIISHPCEVCPGDELRPPRQFYSGYATACMLLELVATCHRIMNNKQCGKAVWFRPAQTEVISAFVGGRDVFVSLPTGYGK